MPIKWSAHHHPATGGEEREDIEPIKCMCSPQQLQVERRERHRANQVMCSPTAAKVERRERQSQSSVCARHTPRTGGEERDIEPIKCMRSPHTSYSGEERVLVSNQVYAPTTHQLKVERSQSANQVMRPPPTSYRWRRVLVPNQVGCAHHTPATGGRRERHRANQVYVLTTQQLQGGEERETRANQVYALTTHQLQVERRES